jgi:hypothetical protein
MCVFNRSYLSVYTKLSVFDPSAVRRQFIWSGRRRRFLFRERAKPISLISRKKSRPKKNIFGDATFRPQTPQNTENRNSKWGLDDE